MNILINAYAVSPLWGSEPGMGWNWISNLARYCNLYIITEGEWQQEIEEAVSKHHYKEHLHFYYLPVSPKIRKICWNQGDWRFYYYYRTWQKRALQKARDICRKVDIDIVHQLNMVGFREPGYLWKIGKPLVWGPVGGLSNVPKSFIAAAPMKMKFFMFIKSLLNIIQFRYSMRVNRAIKQSQVIIAADPITQKGLLNVKKRESILIPETGCYDLYTNLSDKRHRIDFHILWVGRFIFTKRLDLALRTIAEIKDLPNLHFHICGIGSESQIRSYKDLSRKLEIEELCEWHGKVENKRIHEMMRESDLFFFTSIAEVTSTVVPEAINNCLPIVCFNTCGFGPLVTEKIGRKVEMTNPDQSVKAFSETIRKLYYDKDLLYKMSNNCRNELKHLLWEEKAKKVVNIYQHIISKSTES